MNKAALNVPVRMNIVFNQRFAQLVQSLVKLTEASDQCRIKTNGRQQVTAKYFLSTLGSHFLWLCLRFSSRA